MSRYTSNLERNGIQWGETGTWKQGLDIIHLQTFAEKLVIPPGTPETDILNSIPTPWSRLLLFESALFNKEHPSHAEILSQWRGLLGLLALADPLGIEVLPGDEEMTIDLSNYEAQSLIAKTFLDLRPSYKIDDVDVETDKWQSFHFISVDGRILGATSPRTLVFTGVFNNICPPAVPFNEDGRLYDPLKYYRRFGDQKYLALLKSWLLTFIDGFQNNQRLINWLGTFPAPAGMMPQRRHNKILDLFRTWLNEVNQSIAPDTQLAQVNSLRPHFTLPYFQELQFLPGIDYDPSSDLLLDTEKVRGKKNVIVCYRPDNNPRWKKNSMLYNERNMRILADRIKINDGRWVKADETLPEKMNFLPPGWELIADPVEELFEDKLIEINLPASDAHAVYSLSLNVKNFLFPFNEKILNFFEPEELHRYTKIEVEPNQGYYVTLELPLRGLGKRKILAKRFYAESDNELMILNGSNDHKTSELAMWPKFKSSNWNYHYYFKRSVAAFEVDFTPVSGIQPRHSPDNSAHWYFSTSPVLAFVGKLEGSKGLLLPKYEVLSPQGGTDFWNVSVDFGSTHTRAFYLQMEQQGENEYIRMDGARVEPLYFNTYAKQLTVCDPEVLKNDFFALEGKITPASRTELKTLLMKPVDDNSATDEWYPREGFGYLHWLHGGFDSRKIRSDIKWEGTGNKVDLRSYLRWLMVQVLAEAAQQNAKVVKILRSYPSSFNNTLRAHHTNEWVALRGFINVPVHAEDDGELLSEAVATAHYLNNQENAPAVVNTISFDVGGSTTDIAIWYGKPNQMGVPMPTLGVQESVRMAAGIVGKYLQTDRKALEFLEWFVSEVNQQNKLGNISLSAFEKQRNGYALMFYNILSYYEQGGRELEENLAALIGLLKAQVKATGLLAHINYLFGGLIYYSGQLSRKLGLETSATPTYYLYFCGKGGTLIRWINKHEAFVRKLFIAGLFGPDSKVSAEEQNKINVEVKISRRPKEEVGRGLLVKFTYQSEEEDDTFGLYDLRAPSVTVGESGYTLRGSRSEQPAGAKTQQEKKKLNWNDKLDEEVLLDLNSEIPAFHEMKELNHFVKAISEAFKVQDERAPVFDFKGILGNEADKKNLVNSVKARLFNTDESGILYRLQRENDTGALVEPLIITEMKVLLEFLSKNDLLFK
jgi:hypothetical protein